MRPTFLSHLATRPGAAPEALALAALSFLLWKVPAVEAAAIEICAIASPDINDLAGSLVYRADHPTATGGSVPILGHTVDGTTRISIEGTFWGALPSSRPQEWAQELPARQPSAILILAPAQRFTSLWAEIRRRLRTTGHRSHSDHAVGAPVRWARFGDNLTIILSSWSALLASARTRLLVAADHHALAELDQLAALCASFESDAFLPLTVDDLASAAARRLTQLFGLVDDLGRACEARGLGSVAEDGPPALGPGHYERRLRLDTAMLALCLSVDRWATLRETPFWLLVYGTDGRPACGADARLEPLAAELPPRVLRDAETGCPLVPLFAPTGADRETVVAELFGQVAEVARLLGEGPTAGFGSSG